MAGHPTVVSGCMHPTEKLKPQQPPSPLFRALVLAHLSDSSLRVTHLSRLNSTELWHTL
eukprot:m.245706 g.245706  ORF g.245706 m.245706 type:complete len:59 (+) comp26407_c0_seq8:5033-5209(+)